MNEIITDKAIELVWGNADFGENLNKNKRLVIDNALLKTACGYSNGHTAECIIKGLGLVDKDLKLTRIGREYLWDQFHKVDI